MALENQWWHGPRIKIELSEADGGGTGWASLCATHGEYLLVPVVEVSAAPATGQKQAAAEDGVGAQVRPCYGFVPSTFMSATFVDAGVFTGAIRAQIPARKTARRALGMLQGKNSSAVRA